MLRLILCLGKLGLSVQSPVLRGASCSRLTWKGARLLPFYLRQFQLCRCPYQQQVGMQGLHTIFPAMDRHG